MYNIDGGDEMVAVAKDNLTEQELKDWKVTCKKIWPNSLALSSKEDKEAKKIYDQCLDILIEEYDFNKPEAKLIFDYGDVAKYYLENKPSNFEIIKHFLELKENLVEFVRARKDKF